MSDLYDRDTATAMHDDLSDNDSVPMSLRSQKRVFTKLLQTKQKDDPLFDFLISLGLINHTHRAIRCLGSTPSRKKGVSEQRCGTSLNKRTLESILVSLWSITDSRPGTNLWLEYYSIAEKFFCQHHLDDTAKRTFAKVCCAMAVPFRQANGIDPHTPSASAALPTASQSTQSCHTMSVKIEYQETKCVQSSDGTAHSLDIDTALLAAGKDIAMLRGTSRTSAITCLRQATQTSLQFLATNGHTNPCPLLAGAAAKIESATDDLQLSTEEKMALLEMFDMVRSLANNYSQLPEGPPQARLDLDEVPTMQLLAAAWAGLIRDDKTDAADEVEKTGKKAFGDGVFQSAMAAASGGSGIIGEGEGMA
ncbi:hypothetical protein LTS10_006281 [Elasticomyces elasticus]|nr:hypothetical protein LTS10_006281 [Elasticomyces elasticus]